jgi:isoleucyl-tRNA synthetase
MKYRDTLLLPKTDFPMRGELPKREPEILARWEALGLYRRIRARRAGRPRTLLHDGPPYSNNHIHLGTAANKIWKDVVVKVRTLVGQDAPYVPGWDNHGLPIENEVSKEFRVQGKAPDRLALRARCRAYAAEWLGVQRREFRRLGVLGDWERPYLTMAPEFEARLVEIFAELAERGYLFRGLRSIHWCPTDQSALAEAEIEYRIDDSPSLLVAFPHRRGERRDGGPAGARVAELDAHGGLSALAWTTTPWTLPSNLFLMIDPEPEYAVVEAQGKRHLVAVSRAAGVAEAAGWTEVREVARYRGADLLGAVFTNPLDRPSPLVDGRPFVSLEEGTGIVHSAPGHGKEDFEVGRREGFPVLSPVDAAGAFTAEAGPWAGYRVLEAEADLVRWLAESGRLVAASRVQHAYPHCWRCGGAVLFRATRQWFLRIDHEGHREKCLAAIESVAWDPPGSKNRIRDAVAGRPDWCLSRQRSWGVGIPAVYCEACGEATLDPRVMGKVAERARTLGSDDWFASPVETFLPSGFACPQCKSGGPFRKETDILDVWFDSGATHRVVLEPRADLGWPADLYLEGPDQHRGWFNSSLMLGVATRGAAPYRAVQTHGWVLDAKGRAMHKSLGNVISPLEVVEKHGADLVRLWACAADWRADVRVGEEILTRVADAYRKVRNTFRFLLANLSDAPWKGEAAALRPAAREDPLNAAFVGRLDRVLSEVREDLLESRNHAAVAKLVDLCTTDLSAVYLDFRKDALYTLAAGDPLRRSTQAVLAMALEELVLAWSPVLSFTAEEVWRHSPWLAAREESVFLAEWTRDTRPDREADRAWRELLAVREAIYRLLEPRRAAREFSSFAEVRLGLAATGSLAPVLERLDAESWRSFLIVSEVVRIAPGAAGAQDLGEPLGPGSGRLWATASLSPHARCERCWIQRPSVGSFAEHPRLCERCLAVLPEGFALHAE